jgi:hypothetical protein
MAGPSLILEIEAVAHVDLMPGDPGIADAGFLDTPAGMDLALQVGRAVLEAPDACQRISIESGHGVQGTRVLVKVAVLPRHELGDFLEPMSAGITEGMRMTAEFLHASAVRMLESPPPGMRHISGQLSKCITHMGNTLENYVEARRYG